MKKITIAAIILASLVLVVYIVLNMWLKPSIEFTGISSESIISLKDTLVVDLKFTDRDGDIGDSSTGPSKIYVEDTAYHVIQEFPILSKSAIHMITPVAGSLRVLIPLLPLLDTAVSRSTKLKIYITDRCNHKSNQVLTPIIHLSKGDI